jgi:hypothetical protein
VDEAKKRAVSQNVDYDTFKNMVAVAHLKPLHAPNSGRSGEGGMSREDGRGLVCEEVFDMRVESYGHNSSQSRAISCASVILSERMLPSWGYTADGSLPTELQNEAAAAALALMQVGEYKGIGRSGSGGWQVWKRIYS